jgi:hypothetical protein
VPQATGLANPGVAAAGGAIAAEPTPSALASLFSGLCFFHWNFADKAQKCQGSSGWGN